ncbi:hypothetical protein B0H14DRAFT_2590896 [Mycena olivaceomarginata]|nr:hypothetical protein B0H14DRAFT_2590896 [Mycena olivaceomarginata]
MNECASSLGMREDVAGKALVESVGARVDSAGRHVPVLGKPEVAGADWGCGHRRDFAAEGMAVIGSWARRWWCASGWGCVRAGASSCESGTAWKMVAGRGEETKRTCAMEDHHLAVAQVAGGACRSGGQRHAEASSGGGIALKLLVAWEKGKTGTGAAGAAHARDRGMDRRRALRTPKTVEHVRRAAIGVVATRSGGTTSGAGEARDSRAAGVVMACRHHLRKKL